MIRNCDHAVITGCSLMRPMKEHPGPAAVFDGGRVVVGSNQIQSVGDGIRVGPEMKSVVITGNGIEADGHAIVDNHGPHTRALVKDNLLQERP